MHVEFRETEWGRLILVNGIEVGRIVDHVLSIDVYRRWQGEVAGRRIDLGWGGSIVYVRDVLMDREVELTIHERGEDRELINVRLILSGSEDPEYISMIVTEALRRYMDPRILAYIESGQQGQVNMAY